MRSRTLLTMAIPRLAKRRSRQLREPWAKSIKHPGRPDAKSQQIYSQPPHTNLQRRAEPPNKGWSTNFPLPARHLEVRLPRLLRTHLKMALARPRRQKRSMSTTRVGQMVRLTRARRRYPYDVKSHKTNPIQRRNLCGTAAL